MNTISLNLLDRDVKAGCLYDYNNAKILPGTLEISSENIELRDYTDPLPVDHTITTDVSERGKLYCIGISQHLNRQVKDKKVDMNRFWFHSCLNDESLGNCNNNDAHIIAYLKFVRRGERIYDDFIRYNIWRYCNNDEGGTHLIEEVEYGVEFVLWMHKPIDTLKETKQTVEQTMRIELDNYLDELFLGFSEPTINKAFDTVSCSFRSSIHDGCMNNGTFKQCMRIIQELADMEENDKQNIWHPVGIRLRRIPTEAEIRVSIDLSEDVVYELKLKIQCIAQQCQRTTKSPELHRVPFLKKSLDEFQKLLEPMTFKVNEVVYYLKHEIVSPSRCYKVTEPHHKLLDSALNWLKRYEKDVELMHSLLEGNSLPVLDLRSIQEPIKEDQIKRTKVFVVHLRCVPNALDERFKKWTSDPEENIKAFIIGEYYGDIKYEIICKEFQGFLNEALNSVDNDVDYAVGILSPRSPFKEGSVFTVGHEDIMRSVNSTPSDMS